MNDKEKLHSKKLQVHTYCKVYPELSVSKLYQT